VNPHERTVLVRVQRIEVVLHALRRTYSQMPLLPGSTDDLESAIELLETVIAPSRPQPGQPSCVHDGFSDTDARN